MQDMRDDRVGEVFSNHLSESTDVAESVEAHQPVFLYRKNSKTAQESLRITQEFLNRTK